MPISSQNILAHEWIGLEVTIKDSTDPNQKGLAGLVLDETKNTLTLEVRDRKLMIPKAGSTFLAKLPSGQTVTVLGDQLRLRPEDRVKKRLVKW